MGSFTDAHQDSETAFASSPIPQTPFPHTSPHIAFTFLISSGSFFASLADTTTHCHGDFFFLFSLQTQKERQAN